LTTKEYPLPARRPAYSVLATDKVSAATGIGIPAWQEALKRYLAMRN
jgi:dTDP-4-dehydrorhamnose reductase